MHSCLHECIREGMHSKYKSVCMCICIHVSVYICIHECLPVCMHVYQITTPLFLYIYLIMLLSKYVCHIANISHTDIALKFLYMCSKTQATAIYTAHYYHACASNKYASQMPQICHICKLVHVHFTQLYQYQCHI